MRNIICMTVHNRPHLTMINTLVKLEMSGANWSDTEIVVLDDGSKVSYMPLIEQFGLPIRYEQLDSAEGSPGCYQIDGHNNPAWISNWALDNLDCEFLYWMTSDTMVRPGIVAEAQKLDLSKVVWMPCVVDLDTNFGYLSPHRVAPLGWFMVTSMESYRAVRWDEAYMRGQAFEDNDFTARLALHVGRVVVDKNVVCWHQSHPPTAYSDKLKGWSVNHRYTKQKWGGVPWDKEKNCPLDIACTHVNHQMVLDVTLSEGREIREVA